MFPCRTALSMIEVKIKIGLDMMTITILKRSKMEERHGWVNPTPEQSAVLDEHLSRTRPASPERAEEAQRYLAEQAEQCAPRRRRVATAR